MKNQTISVGALKVKLLCILPWSQNEIYEMDINESYSLFETRCDFKDLEETALLRFQSVNP